MNLRVLQKSNVTKGSSSEPPPEVALGWAIPGIPVPGTKIPGIFGKIPIPGIFGKVPKIPKIPGIGIEDFAGIPKIPKIPK